MGERTEQHVIAEGEVNHEVGHVVNLGEDHKDDTCYEEADGVINWGCLRGFPSLLNKRITLLISDPSKGRSSVGTYQIA